MIRLLIDPTTAPGLVWLVTYLAHSTLWTGGAWILWVRVPRLSAQARNFLWRAALVGPFLSTMLQVGAGQTWSVRSVALLRSESRSVVEQPLETVSSPPPLAKCCADPVTPIPISPPTRHSGLPPALLLALAALALVRLALLARGAIVLHRGLGRREIIVDPRPVRLFTRLRARLGRKVCSRLTESESLPGPVALWGGEICLPVRARELDEAALEAVLAHELAHVERRDNLWLVMSALVEAVFFFQPLNRVARRRLQESAEMASDERAVELTENPIGLARSLAQVAVWGMAVDAGVLGSPVLSARGTLVERVNRLLESRQDRLPRWASRLVAVVLGALALSAPALARDVLDRQDQPQPMGGATPQIDAVGAIVPPPSPPSEPLAPTTNAPRPLHLLTPSARVPARGLRSALIETPPAAAIETPLVPASPVLAPPAVPTPFSPLRAEGRGVVLVDKNGHVAAGIASAADRGEALALRAGVEGEYLWLRRKDERVMTVAPDMIASVRSLLDEQHASQARASQVGAAQAELAPRRAALTQGQAELDARRAELSGWQADLERGRDQLQLRKKELRLRVIDAVPPHMLHPLRAEEARSESALMFARSRDDLNRRQREVAQHQHELSRQRGELDREQGLWERRRDELAQQIAARGGRIGDEIDRIIDQQVASGKARVLESAEAP